MRRFQTDYVGHDRGYKKRRLEAKPGWDDEYESRFQVLDDWLAKEHVPSEGRILELGCGAGNMTMRLAEKGFHVVGVEIAPTAIDWAKQRLAEVAPSVSNARLEFVLGNILELDHFSAESFDIVFDSHCLHCIIGEDRQKLLRDCNRWLRPGGLLHVDTMCGNTRREDINQLLDPASRNIVSGGIANRHVGDAGNIVAEVRAAGFEIVDHQIIEHAIQPDLLLLDGRKPPRVHP